MEQSVTLGRPTDCLGIFLEADLIPGGLNPLIRCVRPRTTGPDLTVFILCVPNNVDHNPSLDTLIGQDSIGGFTGLGFGFEFPSSANRMQTLQPGTGSLQSGKPGKAIRLHFL